MKNIVGNIRKQKRDSFLSEMPEDKKGVQFEVNGHKFIMHVRMLSVNECMKRKVINRLEGFGNQPINQNRIYTIFASINCIQRWDTGKIMIVHELDND